MGSQIREKFVEHMEFFGLAKQTQRGYISGVRCLANHYNQSPETLTDDQVRSYFRHLILVRKLAWTSCKTYLSGITYFYRHITEAEPALFQCSFINFCSTQAKFFSKLDNTAAWC